MNTLNVLDVFILVLCCGQEFLQLSEARRNRLPQQQQYEQQEPDKCPSGQIHCTTVNRQDICYSPTTHHCSDHAVCRLDQNGCWGKCFDPKLQVCLRDVICNTGEDICEKQCYSPESGAKCYNDGFTLCQSGEEICGYDCYNRKTAKCYNNLTLCKAEEENCGDECYDPTIEKCFDNKKVCRNNREPCGERKCYWAHNETCHAPRTQYSAPTICPKILKPCGYECYNSKKSQCLKYGVHGYEQICPLDYNVLDGECVKKTLCGKGEDSCGRKCYQLSQNKCIDGVICRSDQVLCGKLCYTPSDPNVKCVDRLICQKDEELCGRNCYLPSAGNGTKCINGIVCGKNEEICGRSCYTPSDGVKCTKGVVCKIDEEVCGMKCYNPITVGPHFHCLKRKVNFKFKLRTIGVMEEEYMACDPGFALNAGGQCQRVFRMAQIDSDDLVESDEA